MAEFKWQWSCKLKMRGLLTLARRASLVGCRKAAGGAASIEPGTRKKQIGEAAWLSLGSANRMGVVFCVLFVYVCVCVPVSRCAWSQSSERQSQCCLSPGLVWSFVQVVQVQVVGGCSAASSSAREWVWRLTKQVTLCPVGCVTVVTFCNLDTDLSWVLAARVSQIIPD